MARLKPVMMHILVFVVVFILLASRRPDGVFHPQFYAEDGSVWFADAYNFGWAAITHLDYRRPHSGYFEVLPRFVAQFAFLFPLGKAPLVFNLAAFVVAALPVNLLLFSRSQTWGSIQIRALMAAAYVALPNSSEVSYGITHSDMHLALCAFLVLLATAPDGALGKVFDISILLICGLTGPYCVFLLPIAIYLLWIDRSRWQWTRAIVLGASSLIEAWVLWLRPALPDIVDNPHPYLGASPQLFLRIFGGQIVYGTVAGETGLAAQPSAFPLVTILSVLGMVLIIFCLFRSALPMTMFLVFSLEVLAAALLSPLTGNRLPAWQVLILFPGVHYWFFPSLAFAWTLLWCIRSRYQGLQILSGLLLFMQCFGIALHWRRYPYPDTQFAESVDRLNRALPGTAVVIPETPPGWTFTLVKRP